MQKILLAVVLLLAASSGHADTLPDAMMGNWVLDGDMSEGLVRSTDQYDYYVEKDGYMIAGDVGCKIQNVEKQAENLYTVQAYCIK